MSIMQLTKNSFLIKKIFVLWTSAVQFPNSFICILDIIVTDSVKLKE